jgi:hypothetical protein
LTRKVSESVQEAIAHYSIDNIKTIVKAAIQRYIESFLSQQGGNRTLLETFSKIGLTFVIDQHVEAESDPTLRKLLLARLFEQIRTQLPCILISESNFEYVPMNWTGIEAAWVQQGSWHGAVQIARKMQLSIITATRDETSTGQLHSILSAMFGEFRWLASGTQMEGNRAAGETWTLTIAAPPTIGAVQQSPLSDDPIDKVWIASIELPDLWFEDRVLIKRPMGRFGPPGTGVMNPDPQLGDTAPIIYAPATVAINDTAQILFDYLQPDIHRVILSDPNVATFEPQSQTFRPRRLGTVEVQVLRAKKVLGQQPYGSQDGATQDVVSRKEIKVVPV